MAGAALCAMSVRAQTHDDAADIRNLLARGQAQEALERVDGALKAQAGDASLRFLRGVALMDLKQDAQAQAVFEQMSQDFPDLPDPWNNLGLLHARAGRLELAREALQTALRFEPGYRVARVNLGWVQLMLAASAWEQALKEAPADTRLRERLQAVRTLLAPPAR